MTLRESLVHLLRLHLFSDVMLLSQAIETTDYVTFSILASLPLLLPRVIHHKLAGKVWSRKKEEFHFKNLGDTNSNF